MEMYKCQYIYKYLFFFSYASFLNKGFLIFVCAYTSDPKYIIGILGSQIVAEKLNSLKQCYNNSFLLIYTLILIYGIVILELH